MSFYYCLLVLAPLASVLVLAQSDEIQPAPASIGTDVPATYFGPPPSMVQKELIGPYQLLKSGTVDVEKGTITLPLYRGSLKHHKMHNIWYVLTDTNDFANAASLGLNPSGKLSFAGFGARKANFDGKGRLSFVSGTVDFSPVHSVQPGDAPDYFPPKAATPGSKGDASYTPVVEIANAGNTIWNAPIIAGNVSPQKLSKYCNGISPQDKEEAYTMLHDKVVAICPSEDGFGGTVTMKLTTGFSFGRPVLYISLDADKPITAALEAVTYAPGLEKQDVAGDDNFGSPVERLFTVINGYNNGDVAGGMNETVHPLRQGLGSAVRGDGYPLNVLGGIPTVATDYSL
eukprot:TRINITY_DN11521_c0_g1_i1.p1 TRINITY_DN11521_c0_g1~~TRINITY_DN11521_c0_g1_i1.p1  ORF type:complete len:344 (-),score=44.74 TRINITY_DN11521_c0_g1_i1:144-1175(-)